MEGTKLPSLCHGMAILLLLHCSLLLMVVVTGNWSDQLMERGCIVNDLIAKCAVEVL